MTDEQAKIQVAYTLALERLTASMMEMRQSIRDQLSVITPVAHESSRWDHAKTSALEAVTDCARNIMPDRLLTLVVGENRVAQVVAAVAFAIALLIVLGLDERTATQAVLSALGMHVPECATEVTVEIPPA